ncbi:Hsp70 protein-domain-containing protein [Piptocephalis cylindrospora]|uniref:Hsp70 protein-domain-containing protein n=1 Tax=Piptocephalis cylindrospora TaxID=1907219 RepID=A0A4P9XZR6_9FUNG|nr:Hsp70 protein-domain-containing protein [Piptocephalis cylindrospora]|eukprot:RKP11973.1 Hsp70 protein-domain-containing protein [Piptocephalis cylindrospora]
MSASEDKPAPVVGLSLGSHYSALAVLTQEGSADVIANEDGDHLTPSVVAFGQDEEFSGTQAKAQEGRNAANTLVEFTALLGLPADSPTVDLHRSRHPFTLTSGTEGRLVYQVSRAGDVKESFTPEQVTTKLLTRLRESAQAYVGSDLAGVCLTVPADASPAFLAETTSACATAGLPVLQFISEPAAAILAYQAGKSPAELRKTDENVLVFDFGGSSLKLAVVAVRGGTSTILGTSQDPELGGTTLDELLMKHFANEFKRKHNIDITGNVKAEGKLRAECERTKKTLSSSNSAPCTVESLAQGLDLSSTLNRMRFDIMCSKVYGKVASDVEALIQKVGLRNDQISEVILAGGSSRIPKLQSRLASLFSGGSTRIRSEITADEVLARGAAVQAGLLNDYASEDADLLASALKDDARRASHTSKTVGVVDAQGAFHPILYHSTPIPSRRIVHTKASADGSAYVALYEGEKDAPAPEEEDEKAAKPALAERKLIAELALTGLKADEEVELTVQAIEGGELRAGLRALDSATSETCVIPVA